MNASADYEIQTEGRLLYALLDAADESGRVSGQAQVQWREAKERIRRGEAIEDEATRFYELMSELAAAGKLSGSWIEHRWEAVVARTGGHS